MRLLDAPLIALSIALLAAAPVSAASRPASVHADGVLEAPTADLAAPTLGDTVQAAKVQAEANGWRAKSDDSIVGLSDPKTLSNPALVDYDALLKATDEMKKMKKDRIDPTSPEGIQLTNAARQRVQSACQSIMDQEGHCSVWKKISHTDGRSVSDITALVKRQL